MSCLPYALDLINAGYLGISLYLAIVTGIYYRKTLIPDFLIFSAFYMSLGFFAGASLLYLALPKFFFISSIVTQPNGGSVLHILYFLSSISGYVFYYLINLYFARGISDDLSQKYRTINQYILLLNIFMYVPFLFGNNFYFAIELELLILMRYSVFMLIIIIKFLILRHALLQFKDTKKHHFYSDIIKQIWKVAIISTMISDVVFSLKYIDLLYSYLSQNNMVVIDAMYLLAVGFGLFATSFVMGISIILPEALLIFRYQIVRAATLYPRDEKEENNELITVSTEGISRYLSRLSEQLNIKYDEESN